MKREKQCYSRGYERARGTIGEAFRSRPRRYYTHKKEKRGQREEEAQEEAVRTIETEGRGRV